MLVIRLSRTGAKKRPFYHVVAIDSRHARDSGNYIERLGYFNPVARGAEIKIHLDEERINHWISKGAQPSERVQYIIKLNKKAASGQPTDSSKAKRTAKKAAEAPQAAPTSSEAAAENTSSEG